MAKSRKRKKKKKQKSKKTNAKPYQVIKQKLFKFENPIPDDIPFDTKKRALLEIGEKAKADYEIEFQNLMKYFEEYDSLYLCAFVAYYFSRQVEGIDEEALNGALEFPPFYLEILQCIAITKERSFSAKPLHENIENFKNTIKALNQNHSTSYISLVEPAENPDDVASIILRMDMMSNTLAVRNWAYVDQMETIAYQLGELVDEKFRNSIGFDPRTFLDILFGLISLTEKKLNTHHKKTYSFIKAKTSIDVFKKYENSFEKVNKSNKTSRSNILMLFGNNVKKLKGFLLEHSDLFLSDIFTHSIDEIHDYFSEKTSKEDINKILNSLSLNFNDLSSINKDFIFLDNPIHSKPFIKISEVEYFSIIPHMFSHLGVDLLEKLIATDSKLKKLYASKKGKYLENKVEKLFREAFPNAKVFTGSLWKCPIEKKVYENDLILIIEDFAIIVECKSGGVSPPAKRGATDRLFKTMKELIVEPSEQAIRFENFLKKNPEKHQFKTKTDTINNFNCADIKYYVPLGVTLSNLGSIGCNLKKLIKANVISHSLDQLAPSISLTDLELIFEILSFQAEKVHYLSRRREFEAHLNFHGDEMDLFGFYLDNGFNIGETEYDDKNYINLTLKSKELDPYFIGRHRGVDVKKPFLQKTNYWADLLNKIEKDSKNWLMTSYILLNLPKEDQLKYEKNLKELVKMISEGKCKKKHNYLMLNFGPRRRQYVIVGFPYMNISKETRNDVINDIVFSIEQEQKIRGFLIIGYNLLKNHYPYSVIAGSLKTDFFDSLML